MDDWQLLSDYATRNSEEAFRELVGRYAGMVYHTALRQLGSPHAAEEATQAVFIALAQKARHIPRHAPLSGWLFRATRFAVLNQRRQDNSRRRHDQEAFTMQAAETEDTDSVWDQISPHLNDALDKLPEKDRAAVLSRFFENKSHKDVAAALGISEAAAKMRVMRAVEKLRVIFVKRGVAVASLALVAALTARAASAVPAGFVSSIAAAATAKGAADSSATSATVKGILKLMAWTKTKIVIVTAVGLLLATGTTTIAFHQIRLHKVEDSTAIWEREMPPSDVFDRVPPQVTILPAKFPQWLFLSGRITPGGNQMIGIGVTLDQILSTAYANSKVGQPYTHGDAAIVSRGTEAGGDGGGGAGPRGPRPTVIAPPDMPENTFDFIANLPSDSAGALAKLIEDKFGWVAKHETNLMDGFAIVVDRNNAPGLRIATGGEILDPKEHPGKRFLPNRTMAQFASFIGGVLGVPVVDQTGLSGSYNFELTPPRSFAPEERVEKIKESLRIELGLKMVEAPNLHQEVLRLEKVK